MADNTTVNAGAGGDTIATDDIGGVKHQRVKLEIGADGSAADVHAGNPLPALIADGGDVTQGAKADAAVTDSTTTNTAQSFLKGLVKILADVWDSVNHRLKVDGSGVTQPVSATSLPLPTGASTEATLALIKAKTDNLDVLLSSRTKPADTQKVDGSAVTQPVSGTFFQATQPISAASLPLPTGAALEAGGNLAAIKTDVDKIPSDPAKESGHLATIDSGLTTLDTDLKATQPRDVTDRAARLLGHVTVDAAALPSGAATDANLSALISYQLAGQQELLRAILIELRAQTYYFQSRLSATDDANIVRSDQSDISLNYN